MKFMKLSKKKKKKATLKTGINKRQFYTFFYMVIQLFFIFHMNKTDKKNLWVSNKNNDIIIFFYENLNKFKKR